MNIWGGGDPSFSAHLQPVITSETGNKLEEGRRLPWRLALLLLLLLGFLLRIHHIYVSGLWFDEVASYFIASKGWLGILDYARLAPGEHPPTFYWPFLFWMNVAGTSEFALRYYALWFGVLFLPLLYRFARRHFEPRVAWLALLIAVPMPFLVDYSREARMYTMVMCMSVLAMDYFLRWAAGDSRAAYKHLAFLLLALSIHYYSILLMAAQDVYLLSRRDLWRTMGRLTILWHLLLATVLAVWFWSANGAVVSAGRAFSNPIFAGRSLGEMARIAIDLAVGGVVIRPLVDADFLISAAFWIIILAGALWAHRRLDTLTRGKPLRAWLFALAIVPPLLATVIPYVYAARYLFVSIPALILLLACGLLSLWHYRRVGPPVAALALLLVAAYGLNYEYGFVKSPYREMAEIVNNEARPSDGLILEGTSQWPQQIYYLPRSWDRQYIPQNVDTAELSDIDAAMRFMQAKYPRLWVLSEQATVVDPGNNVARWLSLNAYPVERSRFGNDAVALYESGNSMQSPQVWEAQFGDWLTLEQSVLSTQTLNPGDGLAIDLRWHALKKIPQSLQLLMTLRLFDSHGEVVQERVSKPCDGFCAIDDWVPGDSVDDRHGLILPYSAAGGLYSLRLEVYSPRQSQSLPISVAGAEIGRSLELARIAVRGVAASTLP